MEAKIVTYIYLDQSDVEKALKEYVSKYFAGDSECTKLTNHQPWNYTVTIEGPVSKI